MAESLDFRIVAGEKVADSSGIQIRKPKVLLSIIEL